MSSISLLEEIGLKEREAEVYLALLELGEASVQEIAEKASLQRPNCYAVLESLAKKGLAHLHVRKGAQRYSAEDPDQLRIMLKHKEEVLQAALPALRSVHNQAPGKPGVHFHEGNEQIFSLYREILQSKAYKCIWSPEYLLPILGDFVEEFGRVVDERGIEAQEIVTGNVRIENTSTTRQVRYLLPGQAAETDIMLFNNRLALISYTPKAQGLVIESAGIVQTFSLLFEALWQTSTE